MSWLNLDLIPEERPLLIVCGYRTGSTALCDYFSNELGRKNFDEAYHPTLFRERHREFQHYKKQNHDYVWKLMPDQITQNNQDDIFQTLSPAFKVKLKRRNIYDQVASWIISYRTNKWHITTNDVVEAYAVNVKDSYIKAHATRIIKVNNKIDEYLEDNTTDMMLYYEDIKNNIVSNYKPRPKPTNYNELYQQVVSVVDSIQNKG